MAIPVIKVGDEFRVDTRVVSILNHPTIARLFNGGFVVAWQSDGINAQLFDANGDALGGEFKVNTDGARLYSPPTITGLANGGFVVAWDDHDGSQIESNIKAQVFDASGGKVGAEFLVNTETASLQTIASVTDLINGGFVITWQDSSGTLGDSSGTSIKAQVFNASGAKQGGEFLVNTATELSQITPTVTGLVNGAFVATWVNEAEGSIQGQVFNANGSKQGSQFSVTGDGAGAGSYSPTITSLTNGGFVIAWYDNGTGLGDSSGVSINAQLFDAEGGKLGTAFLANTKTDGDQAYPTIADLTNGGFVIAWQDRATVPFGAPWFDETNWDIKAQVFDAGGAKQGGEFLVNTQIANSQINPAISGLGNGGFVISWRDPGATPGVYAYYGGIKAQIFNFSNEERAPVITSNGGGAVSALTVLENTSAVTTVQATDAVNFPLTYTINGGADAALFQIDAGTGVLAFISAPDFDAPDDVGANNVYDVIVGVSDGVLADTQALAIAVSDIKIELARKGGEFLVNTETAENQNTPSITALANGGYVITWLDSSGTLGDVSGTSIKAQVFSASGAKQGGEFLVNTETAGDQTRVAITGLANGGFVVLWQDASGAPGDSSETGIKAQVFDAAGSKVGTEFLVNTQTFSFQQRPVVTGLENGNFVVTWEDFSGTLGDSDGYGIKAQLFNSSGLKLGSEFLVNTLTASDQVSPTIAGLPNGGFVISWSDNSNASSTSFDVKAQIFDAGGSKVGDEFLVNFQTGSFQGNSTVTGLAHGGFAIAWVDSSGTLGDPVGGGIAAQIFDASGTKIGSEFLVNTQTANIQQRPKIIGLGNGGFVVTWEDDSRTLGDSSQTSIKAQVFNAIGVKQGGEFLVNTETTSFQQSPQITELSSGDVVITWQDASGTQGDLNSRSIKGQSFSVTSQNSAPEITSNGGGASVALTVMENTAIVTTVRANDVDAKTTLTYSISGGADASRFQINAATGALAFIIAPNHEAPTDTDANNVYDVIVRASDGTLADTQTIAVTIAGINEAPVISSDGGGATASRTVSENSTTVTTVIAADPDPNPGLRYFIMPGPDSDLFRIDFATGVLSFASAPNFEAPSDVGANNVYDLIVIATDGNLTDTQAIAVTVSNVHEAPVITSAGGGASATVTVAENITEFSTVQADANANTPLVFSISGGTDAARFRIDEATGALSFIAAPNFEASGDAGADNVYDVIVSASNGVLADTQTIAVTVVDVNEAPVISSDGGGPTAVRSVAENTTTVTTVLASDPDGNTTVTYAISGGADAARFQINPSTGALAFIVAPDFEVPTDAGANNVYDVVVVANGGGLFDTQALAVTVTDVVDARVFNDNANIANFNTLNRASFIGPFNNAGGGNDMVTLPGTTTGQVLWSLQDRFDAGAGDDTVIGGAGDDIVSGGSGNDAITGGAGVDIAVFSTARVLSTVTRSVNGIVIVASVADGTDTLSGIELFQFSDGLYSFAFSNPGAPRIANFAVGAGGWSSQDRFPRMAADVNGDGLEDIVGFGQAGTFVALGQAGGTFAAPVMGTANFGVNQGWISNNIFHREMVDVNNDGRADIVGFGVAGVFVSQGQANGTFGAVTLVAGNFNPANGWTSQDSFARTLADVNGDGFADIVGFGVVGTFVSLGTGTGSFGTASLALNNFGANQGWSSNNVFHREVGDVNGDGRADIVGFGAAGTLVALGQANGTFAAATLALGNFGTNQGWSTQDVFTRDLADVNGDGRDDVVGFGVAGTFVAYGLANGTFSTAAFDLANFGRDQGWNSDNTFHRELADVNGDGLADIVGFGFGGVFVATAFDGLVL